MQFNEIKSIVENHQGTILGGINWTWAKFLNDELGKAAYSQLDHTSVETRGYSEAIPDCDNPNLRKGGFRFR